MSDPKAVSPTFVADLEGDYTIKLAVDDRADVSTDEAIVTAADLNAIAGIDQFAATNTTMQLDGSQSWNLNGDVFYNWSFVSVPTGSSAAISAATTTTPSFTPDIEGRYEIELVINDGGSNSDSDKILIHSFMLQCNPS